MILKKLFPNYYFNSAFSIDYQYFFDKGYRAIIYDIDNTLVNHDAPCDNRTEELINKLKIIGYKVFIISNNYEKRVSSFAENIPIDKYYYRSFKPSKNKFMDLSKEYNIDIDKFLVIGDQLFTDILGGSNAHMATILVNPIGKEILLKIKLKRVLESMFKFIYKKEFNKIKNKV